MDDAMAFVNEHILPHWPFFAWLLIAMLIGQVMKNTLWTKKNAIQKKPHWFWWWAYKTMVLHPVLGGVIVGLIWQNPEEGVEGIAASMGYFATSGALSTWAYELIKNAVKKKTGVELSLPGITPTTPPKAPDK